ncbi:hypothetical protein J6590_060321 [Homalodisca vitripennis]|nr:hypothetical protein J6590_060321 [Homalodisca vitripennis]
MYVLHEGKYSCRFTVVRPVVAWGWTIVAIFLPGKGRFSFHWLSRRAVISKPDLKKQHLTLIPQEVISNSQIPYNLTGQAENAAQSLEIIDKLIGNKTHYYSRSSAKSAVLKPIPS